MYCFENFDKTKTFWSIEYDKKAFLKLPQPIGEDQKIVIFEVSQKLKRK
jgi:hypothetical protein